MSVVRRAMNDMELRFAKSQATVIIRDLMQELTTYVTRSLSGAAGEENATMAAVLEEHRRMLITVHAQAEDYARAQYKEMQAKVLSLAEQQGQQSEGGTASSVAEATAVAL